MPTFLQWLLAGRHVRPVTLYHILRGKRTFSNLYAAFSNDLLPFWGLLPHLARPAFEKTVDRLVRASALTLTADGTLTAPRRAGQALPAWWPTHVAGLVMPSYRELGDDLTLAVQLLSQLHHGAPHFAPVTPHLLIQVRVKAWYRQVAAGDDGPAIAALMALVERLSPPAATVLTNRLVGAAVDAAGWDTLAAHFGWTPFQVQLAWADAVAAVYQYTMADSASPWASLWPPAPTAVTASAQETMRLLQHRSIAAAAAQRRLAESTIREHVLEAAMLGPDLVTVRPGWQLPAVGRDHVVDFFRDRLTAIAEQRQKGGLGDD